MPPKDGLQSKTQYKLYQTERMPKEMELLEKTDDDNLVEEK